MTARQVVVPGQTGGPVELGISVTAMLTILGVGWLGSVSADSTIPLVVLTGVGLMVAWHARTALYVMFGLAVLFEANGGDPLMEPGALLHGTLGKSSGVSGLVATPLEILLLLTVTIWFLKGLINGGKSFRRGRLALPICLFTIALVAGIARGLAGGGDSYIALWESRWLFYIGICYFLAASVIQNRRHVEALTGLTIVATGLYAIEGAYRRIFLINNGRLGLQSESWYSHDSVIFLVAFLMLVAAQQAFGAPRWQRLGGLAIAPIAVFTLLASERRAGMIALIVAFAIMSIVWAVTNRKALVFFSLPVMLMFGAYLPVFWNNEGVIGQPARAIRSLSAPDQRDAASNAFRDLEVINVSATIASDPLLGVGFGRPFLQVVSTPDISWFPFWNYESHRNVLWIWLKLGAAGFIAFLLLVGSAMALAASFIKNSKVRSIRVCASLALSGVVAVLVFSYVDLGLTSGRVTLFLGVILGALGVLDRIDDALPVRRDASGNSIPR